MQLKVGARPIFTWVVVSNRYCYFLNLQVKKTTLVDQDFKEVSIPATSPYTLHDNCWMNKTEEERWGVMYERVCVCWDGGAPTRQHVLLRLFGSCECNSFCCRALCGTLFFIVLLTINTKKLKEVMCHCLKIKSHIQTTPWPCSCTFVLISPRLSGNQGYLLWRLW